MNPMIPALLLNIFIIAVVCVTLYLTRNPLAILGLFFLQQMPVIVNQPEYEEPEDARSIGFM